MRLRRARLREQREGSDEQGEDSDSSSAHGGLRVRLTYTVQGGLIPGKWQERNGVSRGRDNELACGDIGHSVRRQEKRKLLG